MAARTKPAVAGQAPNLLRSLLQAAWVEAFNGAMRNAEPGECVSKCFARAQASLRTELNAIFPAQEGGQ